MPTLIDSMIERAKADKKTIVLPEGNDDRILAAAEEALKQGIANIIILGDSEEIATKGYALDEAQIIDPSTSDKVEEFAALLFDLRKKKGMTEEEAHQLVTTDPIYFAVMMLKTGMCDGLVGGAGCATVKILSPALKVLKTAPGAPMVSSLFLMDVPNCELGENGIFAFADCALEVQPTAEKLAHIANLTNDSFNRLIGKEARIALLSHSSHGSAKNDDAQKVVDAMAYIKENYPDLNADGELQLDAAIIPEIGASKAPDSAVAGKANVLVFPDLDAANIGYKLVQRLANAQAYGPILQGIAAPVNDLSRGCTAEDVVGVIAITCVQAQTL
ncbi:MAG: phosphate acetyltransferase [Eggerthellaceae bacterium]